MNTLIWVLIIGISVAALFIVPKLRDKFEQNRDIKEQQQCFSSLNSSYTQESGNSRYCRGCGNRLSSNSRVCEICGSKAPILNSFNNRRATKLNNKPYRQKNPTALILIIGIIIFIIFIVGSIASSLSDLFKNSYYGSDHYYTYSDFELYPDDGIEFIESSDFSGSDSSNEESQQPSQNTYTPVQPICLSENCKNTISSSERFCYTHRCLEFNCNNKKIELGSYCTTHTCTQNGCTSQKYTGSRFCFSHKCLESNCSSSHRSNGLYCAIHGCIERDCGFKKEPNSNYCTFHKCPQQDCTNGRGEGFYCLKHT